MHNMFGYCKSTIKKFAVPVCVFVVIIVSIGVVGLNVFASEGFSIGNLSIENGQVAFCAGDVDYLGQELGDLLSQVDYTLVEGVPEPGTIFAYADRMQDSITSHGIINYGEGKVLLNAADLTVLSDRTDELADNCARLLCLALNGIGTYFDVDGNVNHVAQTNEPVVLDSTRLAEGVGLSQSVDHTGAVAIIRDNLTAGTAAWVNGQCIIGSGADNERAYQRGLGDGAAGNRDEVDIQYVYHEHTGNGRSGWGDSAVIAQGNSPGGCFNTGYHQHNYSGQRCEQVYVGEGPPGSCMCDGWKGEGPGGGCTGCGHGEGDHSGGSCNGTKGIYSWNCGEPINHWQIGCGKRAGQIISATVIIHKNNGTEE